MTDTARHGWRRVAPVALIVLITALATVCCGSDHKFEFEARTGQTLPPEGPATVPIAGPDKPFWLVVKAPGEGVPAIDDAFLRYAFYTYPIPVTNLRGEAHINETYHYKGIANSSSGSTDGAEVTYVVLLENTFADDGSRLYTYEGPVKMTAVQTVRYSTYTEQWTITWEGKLKVQVFLEASYESTGTYTGEMRQVVKSDFAGAEPAESSTPQDFKVTYKISPTPPPPEALPTP
jgi:hypothetical protein